MLRDRRATTRCHRAGEETAALFLLATFCLLASTSTALGQRRLPPVTQVSAPAVISGPEKSLEQRLEELEAGHARMATQHSSVLAENHLLSQRLEELSDEVEATRAQHQRLLRTFQDQPDDIRGDEPEPPPGETTTDSSFGEGFKWTTSDGEYDLVIHNETQLDLRAYEQAHSDPVNQYGFYISRMRLYFNGSLTAPIEYSVSINKGLGNLDLLDAYFNFNYDERFQFRVGRFRVPFTYDWYTLSNQFLPTPERSVFAINYGYNRNWGVMLHGELGGNRAEYAVALANGPRNQYFDYNASKDLLAYLNWRPFADSECLPALQYWNIGGSMTYGLQNQAPRPVDFRTSLNATESEGAVQAAPSFLELNSGVVERGPRNLAELHTAYFYRSLTFMGAYDWGYNSYALGGAPSIEVPTHGYHVQASYFLTGEQITRRSFIDPIEPFDLRPGRCGHGAFELQARYDEFVVGDEIFSGGLADGNEWTNRVQTIDAGLNWYLNKFTKIYFDWQHAHFAQPIPYRPGGVQRESDLFWTRFQIYY
ncbi:MAG: hypothetical protein KF708_13765 [Pirellulales bacterium]|nr:hypothetical protein [Pirellulales bacterium]